ncbi:DUF397 domain-containing protein [Streptomyces sp. NPDC005526]|uniref:DUF397 domain-containing protein n=1 Tax=Streptomyces sp. NPDC005526 TaxID=3156885 RepID=UPI0033A39191
MSASELKWFKSSFSSSGSGDCVEVALAWSTSSYSNCGSNDCVEVALTPATVHVRDSKDRQGPRFAVSPAAWGDFLGLAAAS